MRKTKGQSKSNGDRSGSDLRKGSEEWPLKRNEEEEDAEALGSKVPPRPPLGHTR